MAPTEGVGVRLGHGRAAGERAEGFDAAGDIVQAARLIDPHGDAERAQALEVLFAVAALPSHDEIGAQGEHGLEVHLVVAAHLGQLP
ncbi:hypothetical protein RZS08_28900, partial [Arthrospira platensis SPKY1]|nr:hypothetical protein [Arthrospira platensis SPKY1]